VTVRCPLDCEHLKDARKHERTAGLNPGTIPHNDIEVTEEFIASHEDLLSSLSATLVQEALRSGAVDSDLREALASLIQTYRTLGKGVIYESLPQNPLAADLHRAVQDGVKGFLDEERTTRGMTKTRDSDVLAALVFLDVVALDRGNGRQFGRAFVDALLRFQAPAARAGGEDGGSSLVLP
jgi:hypothetical protein